jgi:serine protease Do
MRNHYSLKRFIGATVLAALSCLPLGLSAQMRQAVAVVHPHLSQNGKGAYLEMVNYFKGWDEDTAQYFKDLAKGQGWGSGFFIKEKDGSLTFVTNRHVVVFSDTVDLEFQDEEGGSRSIENCPVVYRDDDLDFAVIAVSADAPAMKDVIGLPLAEKVPQEGTEIWAAGFPGLGNADQQVVKPVWQLSKGNISNKRVVVEDMGLPEATVAIQHTASIDPGNSGGPLFTGDVSNISSCKVIGINSWKYFSRSNTNFSVTLDLVKKALANYHASQASQNNEMDKVSAKVKAFLEEVNKPDFSRFMAYRYVSYKLAADQGWRIFKTGYDSLDADDKETWSDRFFSGQPEEVLRQFAFYALSDTLYEKETPATLVNITEVTENGVKLYRSIISAGKKEYTLDWAEESGSVRVVSGNIKSIGLYGTSKDPKTTKGKYSAGKDSNAKDSDGKDSDERKPTVFTAGSTGWTLSIGDSVLPMESGFNQYINVSTGFLLGLKPWLSLGLSSNLCFGSDYYIIDGNQTADLYLEAALPVHFNFVTDKSPLLRYGCLPYAIVEPSIGYGMMTGDDGYASVGICGALSGGVGFEYCFNKKFSLGIEAMARFELFDPAGIRLNAFPIRAYMTF